MRQDTPCAPHVEPRCKQGPKRPKPHGLRLPKWRRFSQIKQQFRFNLSVRDLVGGWDEVMTDIRRSISTPRAINSPSAATKKEVALAPSLPDPLVTLCGLSLRTGESACTNRCGFGSACLSNPFARRGQPRSACCKTLGTETPRHLGEFS